MLSAEQYLQTWQDCDRPSREVKSSNERMCGLVILEIFINPA